MKKRYFILGAIFISLCAFSIMTAHVAGNVTKTYGVSVDVPGVTPNSIVPFGGQINDTLGGTADTNTYIFAVSKVHNVFPYFQLRYKRTVKWATVTCSWKESNDNVTYDVVKRGWDRLAYSKAYVAVNSDSTMYIDFQKDTALFNGVYLKLTVITSTTGGATTRAVFSGVAKFNSR
jgi:hypothetical protein